MTTWRHREDMKYTHECMKTYRKPKVEIWIHEDMEKTWSKNMNPCRYKSYMMYANSEQILD